MSDSLREQMLKAGFKETKAKNKPAHKKKKPARKEHKPSNPKAQKLANEEAIASRKKIKAEIKTLIETNKIDETKGEIAHAYLVGKRIKQLFVNKESQEKLVSGEWVITRLNGSTYIIPASTSTLVLELNPEWVIIKPSEKSPDDAGDDYADFQVPDDLTW